MVNNTINKLTADANFVFIIPGAIQLTLMLLSAKSVATTLVSPRSAVLLIEYAPNIYESNTQIT